MHLALLVAIEPDPLRGEGDEEAERQLAGIVDLCREGRQPPIAVHVAPHLLARIHEEKGALADDLASLQVEWVRGGWGRPDPCRVPDRLLRLALDQESELLERMGLDAGAFWLRGAWTDRLPSVLTEAGVDTILVDVHPAPEESSGVIVEFDRTFPALRVESAVEWDDGAGSDRCQVVKIAPGDLAATLRRARQTQGHDLVTPRSFLDAHGVRGRMEIPPPPVVRSRPETEVLQRKLVRLATRLPERVPPAANERILAAAHGPAYAHEASPDLLRRAHLALIEARRHVEAARRRGDEWGRVSRLDWDADGAEEVQVEQPDLSLVVDPEESGEILVLDDKAAPWPAAFLPGAPRGRLLRLDGGQTRMPVALGVERSQEAKGEVKLVLSAHAAIPVTLSLTTSGRRLAIRYSVEAPSPCRLGPELALALGRCRVRVDGSDWLELGEETAVLSGHRFRIDGGERQAVISSMVPATVEIEPHPHGLLVWPHWPAEIEGDYEVVVELSP